jgi:hypothetical protein
MTINHLPYPESTESTELDRVLAASGEAAPPGADALTRARARLDLEVDATAVRTARVIRLRRRHRRLTTGLVAAAAGVVAVAGITGLSGVTERSPEVPNTAVGGSPAPVEQEFTTVAQVISAASAATSDVDPTASPYWKVVSSWDCSGVTDSAGVERPAGATCERTIWTGNGRPGVIQDADGDATRIPAGTVAINGRSVPWAAANARRLSAAQVASMVADNADGSKDDRAPSGYYVFKNTFEVLGGAPASGEIRAELWRQLAKVKGVTFNGRATDSRGRSGWRLTWGAGDKGGWGQQSIIVDTSTGMTLETSDRAPGATAWNVNTIVSAGPAQTAPEAMDQAEIKRLRAAAAQACGVGSALSTETGLKSLKRSYREAGPTPTQQACLQERLADVPLLQLGAE